MALLQFCLDCSDELFGAAPELVVKPKPSEQDLDFAGSFHEAIEQIVNKLASR